MSTCHSSKSEQKDQTKYLSSNSKRLRRRLRAIALRLKSILLFVWDIVSTPVSSKPRVWQKRDRWGEYWQVYDPVHDRFFRFNSEQEVRQWLEQNYYIR